jgi:hypothetical protein
MRIQAAVDFLISYGIALLVIAIAIEIMYGLGVLNTSLIPVSCSAYTGFSCGPYFISANSGVMTITLSQSIGGPITINGAACASQKNASGDRPKFGNVYVTNNALYYPTALRPGGNVIYSGGTYTFGINCYNGGGLATGFLGRVFYGFVWLNYTVSGYGAFKQGVAIVSVKYS